MKIPLTLQPEMAAELEAAAQACGTSPRQFAIDAVESVLAERRLSRVAAAPREAHMPVHEETL